MKPEASPTPTRTQGLAIVAMIGLFALAYASQDSLVVGLFGAFAALLKAMDLARDRWRCPRWRLIALAAVGVAILLSEEAQGYNVLAMRSLVLLAVLKLVESNSLRDLRILIFLSFFLLATLFLLTQTIAMGSFGIAALGVLVALLVSSSLPPGDIRWRDHAGSALRLIGLAIPFAVFLFLVFPRLSGPLWSLGLDHRAGISGLSDSMSPGSISELVLSSEIAFRAEFNGGLPERNQMYWRGPVLWDFDGRLWNRRASDPNAATPQLRGGTLVDYRLILEPHQQRWIPALENPGGGVEGTKLSPDLELIATGPVRKRTSFQLEARIDASNRFLPDDQRIAGLALPDELSERTRDLARRLKSRAATDLGFANEVLAHFRENPFRYTLRPPLMPNDMLDRFLFETQAGFCEHYSAAFVGLMRLGGVPARIVTGYLGGELNPHSNQWLVRQSDAHAWTEVWLEGRGWTRVDPTAAVAPERVELGLDVDTALADGGRAAFGLGGGLFSRMARRAQWIADAVEMAWYRDFVNFTKSRQSSLMEKLGLAAMSTGGAAVALAAAVVGVMAFTALLSLKGRRKKLAMEVGLYDIYCRRLEKLGWTRRKNEGPLDFAKRTHQALAEPDARIADQIVQSYVGLRYGRRISDAERAELKRLVATFRPRLLTDTE